MDNQKDIKKTDINHESSLDGHVAINSLINKPIYNYLSKKTEKIVTAIYMVTDCMDTDDALKNKVRSLSIELLSDMHKLMTSSSIDNNTRVSMSLSRIYEILSLIEIAFTIGFISQMNTAILKKELDLLARELRPDQDKGNPFTFSLNNKMFEVDLPIPSNDRDKSDSGDIKDNSASFNKRTSYDMSFTNTSMSLLKRPLYQTPNIKKELMSKEERAEKIIHIIKDNSIKYPTKTEISIKDISLHFSDCSEKTIQRELNYLVSIGRIKKTGAKRWSRYMPA